VKTPARFFVLLFSALALSSLVQAKTLIYPVEGIDDLWKLNADEFHQKYGGINVTGLGVSDEGWYVRYRHENLTYFFGPLADRDLAQKKMWELETVRDAAIRNQPKLASSKVDYVHFNYSGIYGKAGDTPFTGKKGASDGKNGPDGDLDGDGIPNGQDDDMDGDGIGNAQDGDIDGDGIPNGADKYGYGTDPGDGAGDMAGAGGDGKEGSGKDGKGKDGKGKSGSGEGQGDQAGTDKVASAGGGGAGGQGGSGGSGSSGKSGGQKGKSGSKSGKSGKSGGSGSGEGGDGSENSNGPIGAGQNGMQQIASAGGGQSGGQGGQPGSGQQSGGQSGGQSGQQGGQQGGQSGQSGQSGGQSGQSGSQSGGQGGQPGGSPGGSQGGGGGSPIELIVGLFKKILGL
jgi:hypothetical protein